MTRRSRGCGVCSRFGRGDGGDWDESARDCDGARDQPAGGESAVAGASDSSGANSGSITVEHKPAGLLLHIRQSKTDQEGHGQQVAVAHGLHATTGPVAALNAWRALRGDAPGALFTRMWGSNVSSDRLSSHVRARMLRARAEAAGLDGTVLGVHTAQEAFDKRSAGS